MIRVARDDVADDDAARVRDHLRLAVKVEDPGLVRIYDTLEPDLVGVVVEPVVGGDLRTQIAEHGPMSIERARSITIELAKTLDTVHRAGVVHGGLDAAGIGYTVDGRLVIADLGTAGVPGIDDTAVAEDIAALAGVLHEMTCGKPPHDRGRGRELDPSVPPALAGVLELAFRTDPDRPFPSAQHFAAALANEPVAEAPPEGFATAERRWLVPALVVLAVAALLGIVGAVLSRTSVARDIIDNAREVVGIEPAISTTATTTSAPPTTATTTSATPEPEVVLEIARITDFDPGGDDGSEHPERLALINDDDPTRGWQTELYTTRDFGRLKDGVGLVVELADAAELTELTVRSPTRGWAFEVFTSDRPPVAASWGDPVAVRDDVRSDTTVEVDSRPVRSLLLWITDLGDGPQHRVTITDIELTGRPGGDASGDA